MSGWIKIHRSITDHWLYTEKRVFSKFEAWNDILLTVNYTEGKTIIKGKIYIIKRGESILSLESWGKRWGWDKSKVRRFMSLLQNDKMIELKSDTITTHLTVCNYATYQNEQNADATKPPRKQHAQGTQATPIKEEEEGKEEKEISEFEKTLNDFKTMRNKIKKPLTEAGEKLLLLNLEKLSGGNEQMKINILNQSIVNCWQGVFELKSSLKPHPEPERDELGFIKKKSVMHT